MKTLSELNDLAQSALQATKKAGAQDALVSLSAARTFTLKTKNDDVELLKESGDLGLGMRVFVDGRYGGFSTSDLDPARVAEFAQKAVQMVRLTDEDPAHGLPPPELTGPLPEADLALSDPALAGSKKGQARPLCEAFTAAARAASPDVMHVEASFTERHGRSVLLSSAGFSGQREATTVSVGGVVYVRDGQRKPTGHDFRTWRRWADVAGAEEPGKTAAERALSMKGAGPEKTGEYPVVVVNYWGDHFTGMLLRALDGSAVYRKMSCLGDKQGKKLAGSHLTIVDDPLVAAGLGSRRYDDEGIAARRMPLLDKGVLKSFYFSTYWANKQGVRPTTGNSSNIVFAPGKRTGEQMVAALDRGIFITNFIGGNFNPTTGDFSAGIRGFLVDKGKRVKPVSEMNLAGNLLTLMPKLVEVGSDPYPFMSIRSPALRFAPLMISGV